METEKREPAVDGFSKNLNTYWQQLIQEGKDHPAALIPKPSAEI
jgi:hypothetical protein